MGRLAKQFQKDSAAIAFDLKHRKTIDFNMDRYNEAIRNGKSQFSDLEAVKEHAAFTRSRVINNLDEYLIEFESNFTKNGGKVIWATDAEEAIKEIDKIIKQSKAKRVVKSKSIISEEIQLNEFLEKESVEVFETDLGEYIVQQAGEKPYHIVTPAMHKSKEDIADLFHEKFNTSKDASPQEITAFVREKLRNEFKRADIGFSGVNFILSDTGSICITENEGNASLGMAYPKIHIAIAGIERILPSVKDLSLFLPLLAAHGTGQNVTVYNSIVSGPAKDNEKDGPEEMYVILLDNGRSNLLANEDYRSSLQCIRCGACLNVCPVYKTIGGYTYNTTYSGPIGAVITPHLKDDLEQYKHLSFASSLCGACTNVCPVKVPLHDLLLKNRRDSVKRGFVESKEKIVVRGMNYIFQHRSLMDLPGASLKHLVIKKAIRKTWGVHRIIPKFAKKSFNQIWKEKNS